MHDDEPLLDDATIDYLVDPRAAPVGDVARLEALLGPLGDGAALPPGARAPRPPWVWAVAATVLVAVGAGVWLVSRPAREAPADAPPRAASGGWAYTRTSGGNVEEGRLGVGEWLVTGAEDEARLVVPSLGRLDLGPGSRLRLVGDALHERRLELAQGRIEAIVDAPPRLFVVDTPSAAAVDMGCAYTLDVDAQGNGRLDVTTGWVALEGPRGAVHVPAGATCRLRAGRGPGLPHFEGVSPEMHAALTALEEGNDDVAAVEALVTEAMNLDDALILAHAMPYAEGELRVRLLDTATRWAPLPDGTSRDELLALDASAFEQWFDAALR
ncbi:MAG: FecR domain-containing protein [Planctomycetota bacterium]